jgi:hypothetical protein
LNNLGLFDLKKLLLKTLAKGELDEYAGIENKRAV